MVSVGHSPQPVELIRMRICAHAPIGGGWVRAPRSLCRAPGVISVLGAAESGRSEREHDRATRINGKVQNEDLPAVAVFCLVFFPSIQ